jgi:hypothetical protein
MQFVEEQTYDRRLILPVGVTLLGEYGTGSIKSLSFRFYDSVTERRDVITDIPFTPNDPYSANAIETMIGEAHETWVKKVRAQGKKKPKMTAQERKDTGKVLDEIRISKLKRAESTNNKIYYEGTNNDRKKLNRQYKQQSRSAK